jgi:hypothetical protein
MRNPLVMQQTSYLDSVFGTLRRFGEQRKASERWIQCAERTEHLAWKMTFFRSARVALETARRALADADAEVGPVPSAPPDADADTLPPFTVLSRRLTILRGDLDAQERHLATLEAACLGGQALRWTA